MTLALITYFPCLLPPPSFPLGDEGGVSRGRFAPLKPLELRLKAQNFEIAKPEGEDAIFVGRTWVFKEILEVGCGLSACAYTCVRVHVCLGMCEGGEEEKKVGEKGNSVWYSSFCEIFINNPHMANDIYTCPIGQTSNDRAFQKKTLYVYYAI